MVRVVLERNVCQTFELDIGFQSIWKVLLLPRQTNWSGSGDGMVTIVKWHGSVQSDQCYIRRIITIMIIVRMSNDPCWFPTDAADAIVGQVAIRVDTYLIFT